MTSLLRTPILVFILIIFQSKCLTGTYGACLIIILLIQMAAIIAPIVARDEAESMLIKSANRTIQVRLTQTSSDKTQPDPTEPKPDPIDP